MAWLDGLRGRDREIAEEIDSHLEMAIRDRIDRGESPEQARAAVLREFGNVPKVAQTTREVWSWTAIEQLLQDVRFGSRILWRAPGVSASAVILIALVIGGNTTVFSLVHGLVTTPAAGVRTERLVGVVGATPESARIEPMTSYPNYLDLAAHATSVRQLAAWADERLTIGVENGTYAVNGATATTGYFETLGVALAQGRGFRAADDRLENGGLVAVVSDRFWRDRLNARPDAVGRHITLNGQSATIVGVAAPRFLGALMTPGLDVWVPIRAYHDTFNSRRVLNDRREPTVIAIGQLAPHATLESAQAELSTLWSQLTRAYPVDNKDTRAVVLRYSSTAFLPFARFAPYILAIFSIVTALTLLIVSANVANLMLARAIVRQRETAVRQSLGASRWRIVRMLLVEGAVVSLAAWLAACVMAWWISRALIGFLEPARQNLVPDIRPDWTVAGYAMVLAVIATFAFTLAPALRTWQQQVLPWLKAGEQSIASGRSRVSNTLVVLQLAFSVLLLTSAGLVYRSIALLDSGDVGFTKEQLLLVTVRTGDAIRAAQHELSAAEREAGFALIERMRRRLADVHDVTAAAYSRRVPGPYFIGSSPVLRSDRPDPVLALIRPVGPDYLRALQLTPIAGRDISDRDTRGESPKAVVSERLARELWPNESPLGRTVLIGSDRQPAEVVGIAPNAFYDGPSHDPQPKFVFLSLQQRPEAPPTDPHFYIRYAGSLDALVPAIGKAIAEVDPAAPIVSMATMTSRLETVTELERMVATLLSWFAVTSLVIAALGQYAIAMFSTRRRTRDFGVRLALGASASQIQRSVVSEAFRLTSAGLLVGFLLSVGVATALRSVLFGITPTDPPTYAAVFTLLAITSILASYFPAWRAGRVNVVDVLRQE
jgi:predicted permease